MIAECIWSSWVPAHQLPHKSRSSSAFWLETEAVSILLDCSASAVHRMAQEGCDWVSLDAIWISHFHLDHCGGLAPFLFGTKHAPETQQRAKPMRIFGPAGLRDLLEVFDSANKYGLLEQPFPLEIIEVSAGTKFELAGMTASTFSTPHTGESHAIRFDSADGRSLVYTSDTGYSPELAGFARDTDLLLMECSFISNKPVQKHLEAADVVRMVQIANAKRIVLTHLYPEWDGREGEAMELFAGLNAEISFDGMRMDV